MADMHRAPKQWCITKSTKPQTITQPPEVIGISFSVDII